MYKVRLLPLAIEDLANIANDLADYSAQSAISFIDRFLDLIESIKDMPRMYAISSDLPRYRRVNIDKHYCLFYTVDELQKTVFVFRLLHQHADHKLHRIK